MWKRLLPPRRRMVSLFAFEFTRRLMLIVSSFVKDFSRGLWVVI